MTGCCFLSWVCLPWMAFRAEKSCLPTGSRPSSDGFTTVDTDVLWLMSRRVGPMVVVDGAQLHLLDNIAQVIDSFGDSSGGLSVP